MSGARVRLARLEAQEAERVRVVEAAKNEHWATAFASLSPEDVGELRAWEDVVADEPERARLAALEPLMGGPLEDPAGPAARAWWESLEDVGDGQPDPPAPPGAAVYFEREAREAERMGRAAQLGELPPGVGLPDALTLCA